MKRLEIFGPNGLRIVSTLVDVEGENYAEKFRIPLVVPVIGFSLTELSKEENEKLKELKWN